VKKEQFEHAVRAAGAILGVSEVLVIGSQAIHASTDDEFPAAARSIEVDIASLDDADGTKADLIDGSIGELSVFQETFGFYAQGVTANTAVLPDGWRNRLVHYLSPATNGVTALCLEPHDLWISKAIAGRPKDREFCNALIERSLVDTGTLRTRIMKVADLKPVVRDRVLKIIPQM
jgi:hypothetical protein